MRFFTTTSLSCLAAVLFTGFSFAANASGLRSKDIIGITPGMTVEQVQDKITAYNPAMIMQRVSTAPAEEIPSYTLMLQGAIPGKNPKDPPLDEVSVRFVRHADGSVLSTTVSHLVFPLPENERVLFRTFTEKLISKYGPISNMNEVNANEVRWVFNGDGSQKLLSLSSDLGDYNRCSGVISYLTNSTTRAGLAENAIHDCGDFLYVRLFAPDAAHPDVLAGYFMTYLNQDQYLKDLYGEDKANKEAKEILGYKKTQEQEKALENNAVPKF